MKTSLFAVMMTLLVLPSLSAAQPPQYHAEFLGAFAPGRISENGRIIGTDTVGGNQRGFVVDPGNPIQHLPLPSGMASSVAIDINEQGVIVGAVSTYYSPEFFSRSLAWDPDGFGGYTTRYLGALPGQTISRATAVNNVGDIVGYSSDGTYRYPVLFTSPNGVLDLSSTGVFDPVDINDRRVLVDRSFTVKRLDLDTMIAEDLGHPMGSYMATAAAAINEAGQVGGLAILTSGGDCDRVAARYTDGIGWQIFSGCGEGNGVSDMNGQGDVIMSLNVAPYVRFEGLGTFLVEDLIVNDVGHWYVSNFSGFTINSSQWIAVFATNPVTGQSGTLLLRPENNAAAVDAASMTGLSASPALTGSPNPFGGSTGIRYELPRSSGVVLLVFDATGRAVRRLIDGETQSPGSHLVQWDGRDDRGGRVASGLYRLRMETDGQTRTGSVVLLR
jgi:hypothetical protein